MYYLHVTSNFYIHQSVVENCFELIKYVPYVYEKFYNIHILFYANVVKESTPNCTEFTQDEF